MDERAILRSPRVTARELGVSPATLRRWSEEFKEFLSDEATAVHGRSHRRYRDTDLTVLEQVKEFLNNGLTYEQVRQKFNEPTNVIVEPDDIMSEEEINLETELPGEDDIDDIDLDEETTTLATSNGAESPAIAFLTNTLATLSDSQKSILNSQSANRELLGVLLQDNFNLKEENNRLRERILEVEREVSQNRQEDEWRRELLRQELDAKITSVSQLATEAMNTANSIEIPEIKTVENNNPGCLGMLFGGTQKQVVSPTPRKRKNHSIPASPYSPQIVPQNAPGDHNHPKPLYPPE
jgi:DNA-binding transcriptional MerR regulator